MTDQLLKPPARFSHGLVLVLCATVAIGIGAAIGQLPTVLVGSATAGLFLGGFWGLSRGTWLSTAAGCLAVIVAGLGLVLTPLLAVAIATQAGTLAGLLLWSVVPLLMIGGAVAVVADFVPTTVITQDRVAIIALVYGAGTATGGFVLVAGIRLGLTTEAGTALTAMVGLSAEAMLALVTFSGVTRGGTIAFVTGACLWYAARLAELPLVERTSRWLARQWQTGVAADPSRVGSHVSQTLDPGASDESDEDEAAGTPAGRSDAPLVRDLLDIDPQWHRTLRLAGLALLGVGTAALVLGAAPDTRVAAADHPVGRLLTVHLGDTIAPQVFVGGVALALAVVRIGHAVAWRTLHVDWADHRRRLAYLAGSLAVLLAAGLAARPLVAAVLAMPALQYVPVGETGPLVTVSGERLVVRPVDLATVALDHRPGLFAAVVRRSVALVGASAIGTGLLAGGVLGSIVLIPLVGLGATATRLSRPTSGIALLFLGAAGGAVLGVAAMPTVAASVVALLAWDLHRYGAGLASQLDPAAPTLRGELVHATVQVVVVGTVLGATLAGSSLVRIVPLPPAPWQVFGALVCSFGAGLLGLLGLGFWGDR